MTRWTAAIGAALLLAGLPAGLAAAHTDSGAKLKAHLTVTAKGATGSGRFTGTLLRYSNGQSRLTWSLNYRNLGQGATRATVVIPATKKHRSHVEVLLCRPCRPSSHGVVKPILAASTAALMTRSAYVVVSTAKRPKGAIRGRIVRAR